MTILQKTTCNKDTKIEHTKCMKIQEMKKQKSYFDYFIRTHIMICKWQSH